MTSIEEIIPTISGRSVLTVPLVQWARQLRRDFRKATSTQDFGYVATTLNLAALVATFAGRAVTAYRLCSAQIRWHRRGSLLASALPDGQSRIAALLQPYINQLRLRAVRASASATGLMRAYDDLYALVVSGDARRSDRLPWGLAGFGPVLHADESARALVAAVDSVDVLAMLLRRRRFSTIVARLHATYGRIPVDLLPACSEAGAIALWATGEAGAASSLLRRNFGYCAHPAQRAASELLEAFIVDQSSCRRWSSFAKVAQDAWDRIRSGEFVLGATLPELRYCARFVRVLRIHGDSQGAIQAALLGFAASSEAGDELSRVMFAQELAAMVGGAWKTRLRKMRKSSQYAAVRGHAVQIEHSLGVAEMLAWCSRAKA